MKIARLTIIVGLLFAAAPTAAQERAAQIAPETPSGPQLETTTAPSGPRVDAARVGVSREVALDDAAMAVAAQRRMGQPVALMVVGGAAILVGLVIGGDAGAAIAVGGAVIGLIGLFQYLR